MSHASAPRLTLGAPHLGSTCAQTKASRVWLAFYIKLSSLLITQYFAFVNRKNKILAFFLHK